MQYKGLMADNSTKLVMFLPETVTGNQHKDLIDLAKNREVGLIIVDPEMLENIATVLEQIGDITSENAPIDRVIRKGEKIQDEEIPITEEELKEFFPEMK